MTDEELANMRHRHVKKVSKIIGGEQTENIGQFISYLNVNGLNFGQVHNHLRSNSADGMTQLNHRTLARYMRAELGVRNAPDMQNLNI